MALPLLIVAYLAQVYIMPGVHAAKVKVKANVPPAIPKSKSKSGLRFGNLSPILSIIILVIIIVVVLVIALLLFCYIRHVRRNRIAAAENANADQEKGEVTHPDAKSVDSRSCISSNQPHKAPGQ
ncbi:hypothetical protein FRC03_007775 [Tulasnella sp. 419]|nr:hypothetical protein FRC03_007775 [Tulasnella sp. 419]